jgi:hypothetical protein
MQTGVDCAWRTRVTTFYQGAEAAAIIARATCQEPSIQTERARALEAMAENRKAAEYTARTRPFDFADLQGKPEPAKWGPIYTRPPAKAKRFNDETNIPTNCASGQKRCFDAAKHRAKLRAEFAALANADQREWALGKRKSNSVGTIGLTIEQTYAQAMAEKAARLAGKAVEAPKRLNEQPQRYPIAKPARRPRKASKVREAA